MIKDLRYWCQKVLPLVYEDSLSYYELLGKVVAKINEMIELTNEIPDLVAAEVQKAIDSGVIDQIISELLTDYYWVNVKCPPEGVTAAKGDGATDDTAAIQGSINYALAHNMAVFFPGGFYKVNKLTAANEDSETHKALTFIGSGNMTSALVCQSVGPNHVIDIYGFYYSINIRDLAIQGASGYADSDKALLRIASDAGRLNLNSVYLTNAPTGLLAQGFEFGSIDNLTIESSTGDSIRLESCNNITATNITATGVASNDKFGLKLISSFGNLITNSTIYGNGTDKDVYIDAESGWNHIRYAGSWTDLEPTTPVGYTDLGDHNEIDIIFSEGQRFWSGDINNLQGQIDLLPTKTYVDDADAGLQLQIDALPTKTYVDDANAGLQLQIDALPTKTYVDDADAALQLEIDALPTASDIDAAIDTLVEERLFNVRDFGAVGDGTTDDTQAFLDCISYMNSIRGNSKKVMFWAVVPPGKYVLTDQIILPQNMGIKGTWPMRLHGGQEGSWLYIKDDHEPAAYTDGRNLDCTDYGTIVLQNGSAITDLGIYYPDQTAYNNSNSAVKSYRYSIVCRESNSCFLIERITAINPYRFIYLGWAHDRARIRRIFGYPLRIGINSVRSDDVDIIEDIHFHTAWSQTEVARQYAGQNMQGIILKGSDWTQIHNCFIYRAQYGLTLMTLEESSSFHGVRHLTADTLCLEIMTGACIYEDDTAGQYSTYDASSGHRDLRFTNCTLHGNGTSDYGNNGKCVSLGYGRGYNFTNCTFRSAKNTNVDLNKAGSSATLITDAKFIGCYFMENGHVSDSPEHYGNIDNNAKHLIVIGCKFDTGSASTYNHAIRCFAAARQVTILGNIFRNYAGNILRALGGTMESAYMLDNIFDGCTDVANTGVTRGALQTGDGSSVKYLDDTAVQRFGMQTAAPSHMTNKVELYVDSSGNLCYTATDGTKKTITAT